MISQTHKISLKLVYSITYNIITRSNNLQHELSLTLPATQPPAPTAPAANYFTREPEGGWGWLVWSLYSPPVHSELPLSLCFCRREARSDAMKSLRGTSFECHPLGIFLRALCCHSLPLRPSLRDRHLPPEPLEAAGSSPPIYFRGGLRIGPLGSFFLFAVFGTDTCSNPGQSGLTKSQILQILFAGDLRPTQASIEADTYIYIYTTHT